jgi:hypothetical protein
MSSCTDDPLKKCKKCKCDECPVCLGTGKELVVTEDNINNRKMYATVVCSKCKGRKGASDEPTF